MARLIVTAFLASCLCVSAQTDVLTAILANPKFSTFNTLLQNAQASSLRQQLNAVTALIPNNDVSLSRTGV